MKRLTDTVFCAGHLDRGLVGESVVGMRVVNCGGVGGLIYIERWGWYGKCVSISDTLV